MENFIIPENRHLNNSGENNMDHFDNCFENNNNCTPGFLIPHCPVMLVLDTSHSMWGQGLADLQSSLAAFFRTISQENFPNAEIDIAAVSMGDNLGMLEEFTPFTRSSLPSLKIRPKGGTPLGSALNLALDKIEAQIAFYQASGISRVTPQLIVLSDGKSSDSFTAAVSRLRTMLNQGKIFSRAIALGNAPDMLTLEQIASDRVLSAGYGSMRNAFTEVGSAVSRTYENEAPKVIMAENDGAAVPPNGTEYILDGANIICWNGKQNATLKILFAVTDELKRRGNPFKVVFDASTPYILPPGKERQFYRELIDKRLPEYSQAPANTKADIFILTYAGENSKCMIISNDCYRDHKEEFPWIKKSPRRISGMIMGGKLCIPQMNMSVPVK